MTEHYCPPALVYKQKRNKRQFKWRFPNIERCPGTTRWFPKVDLIRADTLLRTQSTCLKWYKINGGKTLALIWNWTYRLYESWHLHMRKLHMGDQSFPLTWSISHLYIWGFYVCQQTHIPHTYWAHSSRPILQTCSADSRPEPPAVAWTGEQDLVREVLTFASWPCPSKCAWRSEPLWCYTRAQVQHPPAVHLLQGDRTATNSNCCLQRFIFMAQRPTLNWCEPLSANEDI